MRVDVSEIKDYRQCKRKWAFSSRNKYHLAPKVVPKAFAFGTLFHECLHSMYTGNPIDSIMFYISRVELEDKDKAMLTNMIEQYHSAVYPSDAENYKILDIEHGFNFLYAGVELCGSIDMLVVDKQNRIFGFEHKSATKFKDPLIIRMDEQMRMYTIALRRYIEELNESRATDLYEFGGIYLNEVKKLSRDFQYSRTLCSYRERDLQTFMDSIGRTVSLIVRDSAAELLPDPEPSPMKCVMCQYQPICDHYAYEQISSELLLAQFQEDYHTRAIDHLDEKANRSNGDE